MFLGQTLVLGSNPALELAVLFLFLVVGTIAYNIDVARGIFLERREREEEAKQEETILKFLLDKENQGVLLPLLKQTLGLV